MGRIRSLSVMLIWAALLGHRELLQVGSAAERWLYSGAALLHSTTVLEVRSADGMRIEEKRV